MITIAFFNNKGGVGKTSLVYHLSWMFAELGRKLIAVDLDPQANLTSMCLDENRLEELWPDGKHPLTIEGIIEPIRRGIGDISEPHVEPVLKNLGLMVGDLTLSTFEDRLSENWLKCHNGDEAAFRTTTAFYRAILRAGVTTGADVALIDVGPNLGAINRAALIASDFVVVPLGSDLFSLQGLRNLGPTLQSWRTTWQQLKHKNPAPDLLLPSGNMHPVGYVVMQHAIREDRPVKAYQKWMDKIPTEYRKSVMAHPSGAALTVKQDPHCLATLKHYRSLMPMAMEAHKPIFLLKPADGAIGAHAAAVRDCYRDFENLSTRILQAVTPVLDASLPEA